MDFVVPAYLRVKLKDNEKNDKYRDLAKVLNKLWDMKLTLIKIVIDVLNTVIKGLVQGLVENCSRSNSSVKTMG